MSNSKSPYIEIIQTGESTSGKTLIWEVRNKNTLEYLGRIKWHGAWRKYVFEEPPVPIYSFYMNKDDKPEQFCWIYDSKCLRQIAEFLENANLLHKVLKEEKKGQDETR